MHTFLRQFNLEIIPKVVLGFVNGQSIIVQQHRALDRFLLFVGQDVLVPTRRAEHRHAKGNLRAVSKTTV